MGTGGSGPLNSRYVGGIQAPPSSSSHYSSSLLSGSGPQNKFNTIHSSVNKRAFNTPNHYESAADRVVGGSGLKDYTRIGEGGGPLLALRERDFMNQNHHMINSGANPAYHLSTLGRSSSMRGPSHQAIRNPDPTIMLLNTTGNQPTAAGTTSAGGSSSSSGGVNSLLTSNEEVRLGSGKRPQATDSAYGTTRSTKKVYL